MEILIATLVVGIVGLIIGIALVFAGKKFYVEVDERETLVRECLPGNNCGACGYPGCDGVAAAIVGYLSIALFKWLLKTDKTYVFAIYTAVAGLFVLVISIIEMVTGKIISL